MTKDGSLVFIDAWSGRSSRLLYLVVVHIIVVSNLILCPVVLEWWVGADCMWER